MCSQNWADCIHASYDDVYGAARRHWTIGVMVTIAAVLIIGGIALWAMA